MNLINQYGAQKCDRFWLIRDTFLRADLIQSEASWKQLSSTSDWLIKKP